MTTIEKIQSLLATNKISVYKLSKEIGLNKTFLTNWTSGKAKPSADALSKIADYFHVSVDYLLGRTDNPQSYQDEHIHVPNEHPIGRIIKMPIIGIIAAGYGGEAREEFIGDTTILSESLHGYSPNECFVLRVSGDSMYPELHNGDLVLIHRQSSVDSGTIAAVMYDDCDATLKTVEYEPNGDWVLLKPTNPEYAAKRLEKSELDQCRILGKLVSLIERHY